MGVLAGAGAAAGDTTPVVDGTKPVVEEVPS
jgi:hypothetical protein